MIMVRFRMFSSASEDSWLPHSDKRIYGCKVPMEQPAGKSCLLALDDPPTCAPAGHGGNTNDFLCATSDPLAQLYNDRRAALAGMHACLLPVPLPAFGYDPLHSWSNNQPHPWFAVLCGSPLENIHVAACTHIIHHHHPCMTCCIGSMNLPCPWRMVQVSTGEPPCSSLHHYDGQS